jgi:hypothetical protein
MHLLLVVALLRNDDLNCCSRTQQHDASQNSPTRLKVSDDAKGAPAALHRPCCAASGYCGWLLPTSQSAYCTQSAETYTPCGKEVLRGSQHVA